MQRMIRQFAAEYTSKNSSTQDPSQPNSTKNQSLPKASPVATSPTAATAQNPVLSKLLMADQDSPLDLTVRKSQSEASEQDGVLDLSTKKSPCAGSTSLSHSPGCSSTQGNGEDSAETLAIDSNHQPKSPLEKFMVRLCTHHQKQFIRVLNDLYTEAQPGTEGRQLPGPETMDVSTCSSGCSQLRTENQDQGTACFEEKPLASTDSLLDQSGPPGTPQSTGPAQKEPTETKPLERRENPGTVVKKDSSELPTPKASSGSPKESSTQGYLTASNSSSFNFHHVAKGPEGPASGHEQEANIKKCEDDKDQLQSATVVEGFVAYVSNGEDGEGCLISPKNSFKALPEETWGSGFLGNSPRTADKENSLQCSSKASLHQDLETNEQDARPKLENHLHTLGRNKAGFHLHSGDRGQFDHSKDGWLSPSPGMGLHKASNGHPRAKTTPASIKTARKSKRASGLRINDYDNQCDVVYISQPITECHFENQRAILSSRKTARKSTRGYFFNGDCCELPTVRTLARSLRSEDKGSCSGPTLDPSPAAPGQALGVSDGGPASGAQAMEDAPEGRGEGRVSQKEVFQGSPPRREPQEPETRATASPAGAQAELCRTSSQATREAPASGPLPALRSLVPVEKAPKGSPGASKTPASRPSSDAAGPRPLEHPGATEAPAPPRANGRREPSSENILDERPEAPNARPPSPAQPVVNGEGDGCSESPLRQVRPGDPVSSHPESPKREESAGEGRSTATGTPVDLVLEQETDRLERKKGTLPQKGLREAGGGKPAADLRKSEAGGPGEDQRAPDLEGADQSSASSEGNPDKKKKKGRKVLVASDRRLRSQLSDSPTALQLPCLQIKLSKSPGAKCPKREVYLGSAASVHFPTDCFHPSALKEAGSPSPRDGHPEKAPKGKEGGEGGVTTRQTSKNMLARENVEGGDAAVAGSSPAVPVGQSTPGERLEICVRAHADGRRVHLPSESRPQREAIDQEEEKPTDEAADALEDSGRKGDGENEVSNTLSSSDTFPGHPESPKSSAKPRRLISLTYNLRRTHPVDPWVDTRKKTSDKEAMQVNSASKEERAPERENPSGPKEGDPAVDDKPKFVEWCSEEENQELIADFNAQYMRVQKGWIQLEKEAQPTPKAKNKSDKLKEIWKSKKRSRKCRGLLEVQKLSPIQMLFMKAFKLSNICRWFLETTETRSLVIVKKLNTRLPGDVPPIKIPLQKYPPSGPYPSSLQAERLKKHLKKFPGTTPARNNWKNQKLWARLRENAEKGAPEEPPAGPPGSHPEASAEDGGEEPESSPSPPSLPSPASSRILRKYSNLRGKLRAQQRLARAEKKAESAPDPPPEQKQSRKSVCINPLMSPKLALQVNVDVFPLKSGPADGGRGRKGKTQAEAPPKADLPPGKKKKSEENHPQEKSGSSTRDRLPAKKTKKAKGAVGSSKAPTTRKRAALEKITKLAKKASPKERKGKKGSKKPPGKGGPPVRKGKENPNKKPSPREPLPKSPKPKGAAGEPPHRSQKASDRRAGGGKSQARSGKKTQESSGAQRKRKLRAKLDCSHNKRRRLDTK
ncbi:ligand-dependent corepressor isoform X1 [Tachyglossus aculeatus]|uniref:ligand-dependent corepressor isoform X1 n=1 Tax=Tachyglossus aculeatus TaxID=9261 RepID=UPI0018F6BB50|nr:ligand-dependent corepressor isoform X1 [Tachyglossus aculeatus]XP_038599414.1 ligand-dependent corepressor isoform X1 [Tachyglossus aculeatus]XP_038599415.1 ligand-dependent corepressor isoform X1 [Tachyglossus aculeatus]XP_038599416.1 ligand-dependent corepressor isoform X1 [Tachyglossus aculeatus]